LSPPMKIEDYFNLNIIDPCLTTVISDSVIKELVAFYGHSSVSTNKLAFTDSASVRVTFLHPTVIEFCGPIVPTFFCNLTESSELMAENFNHITFSPTVDTKPGKASCTLVASLPEVDGITRKISFTATTLSYIVTPIPNHIYYVGSQLLIPYTKFKIYPEGYFDTNDYRLNLIDNPPEVNTPLDLGLLQEADSDYFTFNKNEQTIKVVNSDSNIPIPLFQVVLAAIVNDTVVMW